MIVFPMQPLPEIIFLNLGISIAGLTGWDQPEMHIIRLLAMYSHDRVT